MSGPGAHSPVGASSASRFLKCPLSITGAVGVEPDEESDHASLGTAVHSLIEDCFRTEADAWTKMGIIHGSDGLIYGPDDGHPGIVVTKEMTIGAQVMLDEVRKAHPDRNQGNFWVERRFHCKMIHELFYGTCDALYLDEAEIYPDEAGNCTDTWTTLHVWDYKNGAGIVVEVERNVQTMYYACGALEEMELWDKVDEVVCHIVQPNAFHQDGKHRIWRTTPEELATWLETELVPGINRALESSDAVSGTHCVFCPLRGRKCPAIMAEMEELYQMTAKLEKEGIGAFDNHELGRLLDLTDRAAMVKKAALKDGFNRAQAGQTVTGWKLVPGRAYRKWKDGADDALKTEFGERALTEPEVKSPAEIDKLPLGTTFTSRWAQKPDAGLTLVKDADQRGAVVPLDKASLFSPVEAAPMTEAEKTKFIDEGGFQVALPRSTRRKAA